MDWKNIVDELLDSGWTQGGIAKAVGRSQAWVSNIVRGMVKDVMWHDGERLRKLHARVMRRRKHKDLR